MKQLIIIFASVILGIYIYGMILGDEDTVKSAAGSLMEQQIEMQKRVP